MDVACPFRMLGGPATVSGWATKELWSGAAQVVDEGRVVVFLGELRGGIGRAILDLRENGEKTSAAMPGCGCRR